MIKNRIKKILSIILILIIVFTDNTFASTIIDLTNGITGTAPEHSHIWNYKYTNTKHWEECSVCNIKRNETTHTLTGNGGSKVLCENGYYNKAYRAVCATCGYQSNPQVVLHGRYENFAVSRRLNYGNMIGITLDKIKQITYSEYSSLLSSYQATTDAPGGQSYTWYDDDNDGYGWVFCGGPIMSDNYGTKGTIAMIIGSEGDCGRKQIFDEYFALTTYIDSDITPTRAEFVTYLNNKINNSSNPTRHVLYGYNTKYNTKVTDAQFSKIVIEFKGYYPHISAWGWTEMNILHANHDNLGRNMYNSNNCYDSNIGKPWTTTEGYATTCDLCGAKYNGSESYVNNTWYICNVGNQIRTTPGVTKKCGGHRVYGKTNIFLGTVYCTFTNTNGTVTRKLSIENATNCTGTLSSTATYTLKTIDTPSITSWEYVYTATFTHNTDNSIKRTINCGYYYLPIDNTAPVAYNHSGNTTNNSYWQVSGNGSNNNMSTQASVKVTFKDPVQYSKNILKARVYDEDKTTLIKQKNGDEFIPLTKLSNDQTLWQGTITINTEVATIKNIYIQAVDSSGLSSNLIPMEIKYLDTTGPDINTQLNTTEWSISKDVVITASDISGISVGISEEDLTYIDNMNVNNRIYSFTGDIYEEKKITFYGIDSAGNLSYKILGINKIDNTSPTITDVNKKIGDGVTTFTIEGNDINENLKKEGSGIKEYAIAKENEKPLEYQTSNIFQVYEEGNYVFYIKDRVGFTDVSSTYNVNNYKDEMINIIWDDNNNKANERPDTYIIEIYRDGNFYKNIEVLSDITNYIVKDLPIYNDNGEESIYSYNIVVNDLYKIFSKNNTFECEYINTTFNINIPKEIKLDTHDWITEYKINVKGNILNDDIITVTPDKSFIMTNTENERKNIDIQQKNTKFIYNTISSNDGQEEKGIINAKLSEGEWSGKFNFNINFRKRILDEYSWDEISKISVSGLADKYFKIGDEKKIILNNDETYNVQIIGFNHDNLADSSSKAGITFQFKEVLNTHNQMNIENTNIGGWKESKMRLYLNEDIYNLLPTEVQNKIKEVDKISDAGNMNTSSLINTNDKLFLLSFEEVGFTSSDSVNFVTGQGKKYDLYTDNASRIKYYLNDYTAWWWLRSTYTGYNYAFWGINTTGINNTGYANLNASISPAFCI